MSTDCTRSYGSLARPLFETSGSYLKQVQLPMNKHLLRCTSLYLSSSASVCNFLLPVISIWFGSINSYMGSFNHVDCFAPLLIRLSSPVYGPCSFSAGSYPPFPIFFSFPSSPSLSPLHLESYMTANVV